MACPQSVCLLATLAYADIFDYPLTREELRLWCIKKNIRDQVPALPGAGAEHRDGLYFLRARGRIVSQRKKRQAASFAKWRIARWVALWLRLVPTIQLVGVTGGLAMDNVGKEDDIDLFIITKSGTIWISRMIAALIVSVLGRRRKPEESMVADKVCLNMFMSEESVEIVKKERDLFAAHEVLQMKPLWERGNIYKTFLDKNRWVATFLPNAWAAKSKASSIEPREVGLKFGILCLRFMEQPAKVFQLWYMNKRRTSEVVGDYVLRFHPRDARVWVKEALRKRLDHLDIPLDKIFYFR